MKNRDLLLQQNFNCHVHTPYSDCCDDTTIGKPLSLATLRVTYKTIIASLIIGLATTFALDTLANSQEANSTMVAMGGASPITLPVTLRLAVPKALPVLGEEQMLVARMEWHGQKGLEVVARFAWRSDLEDGLIGRDHPVTLTPGGEEITVNQSWNPEHNGDYMLTVQLLFNGLDALEEGPTATQNVTVVGRRLNFHYWAVRPSLKYITEGMVNNTNDLVYWTDRGMTAQAWKGGRWAYTTTNLETPEMLAEYWSGVRTNAPGIVIDEFGCGGEIDEVLGQALIETKIQSPNVYIAAYTVSGGGDQKMLGLRDAADLVLVETYCSSATYGYKTISNRVQLVREDVGEDKLLVALGLKHWISTPQELRRQLHFTRYTFPKMPGVALFGGDSDTTSALYPSVNELIRQFYIDPVLHVTVLESGQVRIENIGGDRSPPMQVMFRAADQSQVGRAVPALDVSQRMEMSPPRAALHPVTQYSNGCFVLCSPELWDNELAEYRPNATAQWPAAGSLAFNTNDTFYIQPEFKIQEDQDGYDWASYAIPSTGRRACELRFDMETIQTWFYGSIRIELTQKDGTSLFGLSLGRGDYEPGTYATVSFKGLSGHAVKERMALIIEPSKSYRLKLRYEPQENYVRAAIMDPSGATLWDSGEIPTYGEATFDHVRFAVRNREGSSIEWDPERKDILLRGTGGAAYVMSVHVDNVKIDCFAP